MGDRVKEFNSLTNSGRRYERLSTILRFRYLNFEDRVTTVNSVVQVATLRYSKRAEKVTEIMKSLISRLQTIQLTSWKS